MSREPLPRAGAVVVAAVVALAWAAGLVGCSVGSAPSRGPAGSAASTGSGDPGGSPCRVEGFVPTTRLVTRRSTPVVLYGTAYTLAPASSVGFSGDLTRIEPVPLRVRVTRGGPLGAQDRDTILSRAGAAVTGGDVAPTLPIRHRLANRTRQNQSYLFYRGARALSGRWTARRCGAPYNDGRRTVLLAGTFRTVGPTLGLRLAVCSRGAPGEPADRGARGVLAAKAASYACSG